MILLSHPTGNSNVRAVARALHSNGLLSEFHSSIFWDPDTFVSRHIPARWQHVLNRRSFNSIPKQFQYSHPWREIARLLTPAVPLLHRHEKGPLSVDCILQNFDKQIAKRILVSHGIRGVYAYEDCASMTFDAARSRGIACFYDLPIGYWRAAIEIYEEERSLQPDWSSTITGLLDSKTKLARKDHELAQADVVLVASSYVKSTLCKSPLVKAPIVVIPYGAPPVNDTSLPELPHRPLRVLYVGSLGQRKGLSYLLQAIDQANSPVKLTLIGRPTSSDCNPLRLALQSHQWIPTLSHQQVLQQMRQHHVLVFPTLFDGFGLVILEALSQGLPVISTTHSGAPECIRNGQEGFIVPIRDSDAIASCLDRLANDADLLQQMRMACFVRASQLQWSDYEHLIVNTVIQYLS